MLVLLLPTPLRTSPRSWRPTTRPCAPPRCGPRYARTYPRAPAGAAPTGPLRGSERRLSRPLRPSSLSTTPPRAEDRTCFYAFVHYVHTLAGTRLRQPARRIKTRSASCARPARAHPLSATLNHPVALEPLEGFSALVGPATARAARHVASPPRSPRSRRKVYRPATIAPGFAKPQPVTLVANPPEEEGRRTFFSLAANGKRGG